MSHLDGDPEARFSRVEAQIALCTLKYQIKSIQCQTYKHSSMCIYCRRDYKEKKKKKKKRRRKKINGFWVGRQTAHSASDMFSKFKYLIVNLVFPTSVFGVGISF